MFNPDSNPRGTLRTARLFLIAGTLLSFMIVAVLVFVDDGRPLSNRTDAQALSILPVETTAAEVAKVDARPEVVELPLTQTAVSTKENGPAETIQWRLRGRVIDAISTEPVPAFRIKWSSDNNSSAAQKMRMRPVRDEKGEFDIKLPTSGPWILSVDGGEEYELKAVEAVTLPRSEPLLISLPPATLIEGTVRDDTGAPVAGVHVSLRVEKLGLSELLPKWTLTPTNSAGRFRFSRVPPATFSLRVAYHEVDLGSVRPFEVGNGDRSVHDVIISAARNLRVIVLNDNGEPVQRARVTLRFETGETATRTGRSNSAGVVALRYLPEGRATLRIAAAGFDVHEEPVELSLSVLKQDVTCRLAVAGQ